MSVLKYVNVKQGTASVSRFSKGNTLPLTALPHAMAAFAPQTDGSRGAWWYHPEDRSFEGIRLTHQPSPWVGDFSHLCFMPQSGEAQVLPDRRWCSFRPDELILAPHRMQGNLRRYGVTFDLTPTDTGCVAELRYRGDTPRFAVLPFAFEGEIEILPETRQIRGMTTAKSFVPKGKLPLYFIFEFDADFLPEESFTTDAGGSLYEDFALTAKGAGANVALARREVTVRLATSYQSYDQAEVNLQREKQSFSRALRAAERAWEEVLSRIEVPGTEEQKKLFYSCLYRVFLYPTKFYEPDRAGKPFHLEPESGVVKPGVMYVNNGFWDTYRTVWPLYALIAPEKAGEMIRGFLNFYDDTGYLPRWPAPSEFGCMPGTLIEAVLADAAVKGLLDRTDCERALEACLKNAEVPSDDPIRGRKSVEAYRRLGYVPNDRERESVNETLDCAYGDFCIGQIAQVLGKTELAARYHAYGQNYKNLFDPETGFMRGRDSAGQFRPGFSPIAWGGEYTEGSAWQNSFAVPQDPEGLAALYGGPKAFLKKVDEIFDTPPDFEVGGYGFEIHEMSEMAAQDFGQCAISNQPSFHFPWYYAALGQPQKTREKLDLLLTAFSGEDGGFPGDEDNGTMAAWVVFAFLGLYPMCPGKPEYVCTTPLVEGIKILGRPLKKFTGSKVAYSEILKD